MVASNTCDFSTHRFTFTQQQKAKVQGDIVRNNDKYACRGICIYFMTINGVRMTKERGINSKKGKETSKLSHQTINCCGLVGKTAQPEEGSILPE